MGITIPTSEGRKVQSAPVSGSGVKVSVPDVPMPQAGREIEQAGMDIYAQEIQRANEIAVLDADLATSEFETNLLHDPDNGALNARGKDAAEIYEPTMEVYDKHVEEVGSGLNDAQGLAYRKLTQSRRKAMDSQLQRHMSSEGLRHDTESTSARILNEANKAAENYGDPTAINNSISRIKEWIAQYSGRNGLGADEVKKWKEKATSEVHKTVINQLKADGRAQDANDYYKEHDKEIHDDAGMRETLRVASDVSEAADISREIFTQMAPPVGSDEVINMEEMMEMASKWPDMSGDKLKMIRADLIQRRTLRDDTHKQQQEAAMNGTWGLVDSDELTLDEAQSTEEYDKMSNLNQKKFRDSYLAMQDAKERRGKLSAVELAREHQLNFAEIVGNEAMLKTADIDSMLRNEKISSRQHEAIRKLRDPMKSEQARIAVNLLSMARQKRLFNSVDAEDNMNRWAASQQKLVEYIFAHPNEDATEFVNKMVSQLELGWADKASNVFRLGQPGTVKAEKRRKSELADMINSNSPIGDEEADLFSNPNYSRAAEALRDAGNPVTPNNVKEIIRQIEEKEEGI